MNSDFKELLKRFNAGEVRYLVVGGYAVMKYTETRYTKDLDIWIDPTPKNARAVFEALREFGAPLTGLAAADFAKEGAFYQMGRPPARDDRERSGSASAGHRAVDRDRPAFLEAAEVDRALTDAEAVGGGGGGRDATRHDTACRYWPVTIRISLSPRWRRA